MNTNEEKERQLFEEWYEAFTMPLESDWFAKDEYGDYKLPFVQHTYDGWQAGRAALRAESEAVYQVMNYERDWYDVSKEEYDDIVTTSISKRILYTAPQTEPNGTGSEI